MSCPLGIILRASKFLTMATSNSLQLWKNEQTIFQPRVLQLNLGNINRLPHSNTPTEKYQGMCQHFFCWGICSAGANLCCLSCLSLTVTLWVGKLFLLSHSIYSVSLCIEQSIPSVFTCSCQCVYLFLSVCLPVLVSVFTCSCQCVYLFLYRMHGPISYSINLQLINSSFLQHLPTKLTFFLFLHIQIPVSSLAKLCQSNGWLVPRGTEDICVWYMGNLHVCWWSGWYNASGKEMSRIFEEVTIQIITTCIYWAIPEITCTPPKEDMRIPTILPTFFIGKSKKIKHFFGCKGKEDMGIPKIFNHFQYKKWEFPIFLTIFDIKNWKFPFFKTICRIPIF